MLTAIFLCNCYPCASIEPYSSISSSQFQSNSIYQTIPKGGDILSPSPSAQENDLTGIWKCDDKGTYYIRQIEDSIWWYAVNSNSARVAKGSIKGNTLSLYYVDVPKPNKGEGKGSGKLTLNRISPNELKAIQKPSDFDGLSWTRIQKERVMGAGLGPALEKYIDIESLTGVWLSDTGETYYIRQLGDNTVWWYGESSEYNPESSNVAKGTRTGNMLNLDWVDVPKGEGSGSGKINLEIRQDRLVAILKTGGFSSSEWQRKT